MADAPTQPSRAGAAPPAERPIDRYELERELGTGAMGVVWEAHDRLLDRAVAVKLLHDTLLGADFQARLADEARVMARLAHPNIVTVFDAGEANGRAYLVMELVRGRTLEAWLAEPRDWRAIASALRDAARGVAAAHHASIIHRDLKPSNILVGDDGRVRVADFGIAALANAVQGEMTGTPRYMAPERRAGAAADEASDQYSLFAVLHEALFDAMPGEKPNARRVPAWLRAALDRGLAEDPARRFSSMDAAIVALDGPSYRGRWIAAGAVCIAGATGLAFTLGTRNTEDPCSVDGELVPAWSAPIRERIAAHFATLGAFAVEEAPRVTGALGRYAAAWLEGYRATCNAHHRGDLGDELYARMRGCYARARVSLATAAEHLGNVPADQLQSALVAASTLAKLEDCQDMPALASPPPDRAERVAELDGALERARVLGIAHAPDAPKLAEGLVREARATEYAPLVGRAELVHGIALLPRDKAAARAPLVAARNAAFAAGDDALAIEAYAREMFVLATMGDDKFPAGAKQVLGAMTVLEPIAKRAPGMFAYALFLNNAGTTRLAAGDRDGARSFFERARALVRSRPRADDVELALIPANVSLVEPDEATRIALVEESRAELVRLLGSNHGRVLDMEIQRAMFTVDPAASEAALRPPCERYAKYHAGIEDKLSDCMYELAWFAHERGDRAAVRAAVANVAPNSRRAVVARALAHADDTVLAELEAHANEKLADAAWWLRRIGADALVVAGDLLAPRDPARACVHFQRALPVLQDIARLNPTPPYERAVARANKRVAACATGSQ
jgi:hypothetical protein